MKSNSCGYSNGWFRFTPKILYINKMTYMIIIAIIFSFNAFSNTDEIKKICDDYNKIADIIVPYKNNTWTGIGATPSGPVPIFVYHVENLRSPLNDFCKYLVTMDRLDDLGRVETTADFINKMTNDKHKKHSDFLLETLYLTDAVGNHLNTPDEDKRDDTSLHRKLNRYLKIQDEYFNGDEAHTFETRTERERKMEQIIKSSNKLSKINDLINCKTPERKLTKEKKEEYDNEILPIYQLIDEDSEEAQYYLNKLQLIGTKFLNTYDDFKKYQNDLHKLYAYGAIIDPLRVEKNSSKLKDNRAYYFEYNVRRNKDLFQSFLKDYQKKWDSYMVNKISQDKKILYESKDRNQNEFRDLSFECRKNKIAWQVRRTDTRFKNTNRNDPLFIDLVDRKVEECRKSVNYNNTKIKSLFSIFTQNLFNAISDLKNRQSIVWTYESKELGEHRLVYNQQQQTDLGELSTPSVKCPENLNVVDSKNLKIRAQQRSIEAREDFAREATLTTYRMRKERSMEQEKREKARREKEIERQREKRKSNKVMSVQIPEAF